MLQNISAQVSKLPESTQIEAMMIAVNDTTQQTLIEIQRYINHLNRSVPGHEKQLVDVPD